MDTSSGRTSRRLEAPTAPTSAAAGAPLQPLGPWADAVTRSFVPLITHAPRGDAAERFRGRLSAQQLGGARASIVAGSSVGVARTPREIARENPGHIKVGVQLGGSGVITQDGRDAVLRAGDFAVYDTTRPYALRFDEPFRMFVLMFPIEALHVDRGVLRAHTATRFGGGATAAGVEGLASGFLCALGDAVDRKILADRLSISDAAFDLLVAALTERADADGEGAASAQRRVLSTRVDAFIAAHLGDPHLSVPDIARAHHISVRALQKLFEGRGETVSGWIRQRRLEQTRRDLANAALVDRSIAAIGASWGFTDAAAFSRAFKNAYGLTPREYRAAGLRP